MMHGPINIRVTVFAKHWQASLVGKARNAYRILMTNILDASGR